MRWTVVGWWCVVALWVAVHVADSAGLIGPAILATMAWSVIHLGAWFEDGTQKPPAK